MALDFSKFNLNFFSKLDARARVLVLFAGVIGMLLLVYLGTIWLAGGSNTVGPSKVASAPQSLQSIPGGQLTPEYYRALSQANTQAAEQAKITGSSAVPTLINVGQDTVSVPSSDGSAPCVICSDQNANVQATLNDLVKQGKITPEVMDQLNNFAKTNPMPDAYAAMLSDLVKQNKITPEQARMLLDQYKKQHANVMMGESSALMDGMIKSGDLPIEAANELLEAQKAKEPTSAYAARLQRLVKEGKISPDTAQKLLAQYTQQRAKEITMQSIVILQQWSREGKITPDVLAKLIEYENQMVAMDTFTSAVNQIVGQGKLTPTVAEQIIDEYKQQKAEIGPTGALNDMVDAAETAAIDQLTQLDDMVAAGKIAPNVAAGIESAMKSGMGADEFKKNLDQLVRDGKISAADAKTVLANYHLAAAIKSNVPVETFQKNLDELVRTGQISPDDAKAALAKYQVAAAMKADVPVDEFKKNLDQLVREGKITPEAAKTMLANYQRVRAAREMAAKLNDLQQNNATATQYAEQLKSAVAAGLISPEKAADLMRQYQAITAKAVVSPKTNATTSEFAQLQRNVQRGGSASTPQFSAASFNTPTGATAQQSQELEQQRAQQMQAMVTAMSGQAQQLVASWQPPTMDHKAMVETLKKSTTTTTTTTNADGTSSSSAAAAGMQGAPLIKAGTILFAVLDTAVNSDYPDSPVIATIVAGKYKGAKMLGKLTTTKSVSGQMDRVSLNFTLMNLDEWPNSQTVTAYAIDPDTARTVLASNVNYHYMMRFGAIMATSFMQGYGNAISTSGATTGIGLNGTQTTSNPAFSPGDKIAMALGQIGQTLGTVTQNYVNTPPTVKVDSGVSLGILFMADVTNAANAAATAGTTAN